MKGHRQAVLVAGNSPFKRTVRELLTTVPSLRITEAVATEDIIAALSNCTPDLLFLVPDNLTNAGLDLAALVLRRFPSVRLVVITRRSEIDLVIAFINLGVAAYLLDDDTEYLVRDLDAVCNGCFILGHQLSQGLIRLLRSPHGQPVLREALAQSSLDDGSFASNGKVTAARREAVIDLVGQGFSNKQIADTLNIGLETVKTHLKRHRARNGPTPRAALGHRLRASTCGRCPHLEGQCL